VCVCVCVCERQRGHASRFVAKIHAGTVNIGGSFDVYNELVTHGHPNNAVLIVVPHDTRPGAVPQKRIIKLHGSSNWDQ